MTENEELRVLLFLAHSNGGGYSDDGELQDTSAEPHIDWKRDSVASIKAALDKRAVAFFEAEGITPDMIKESLKTGKPVRGKTAARVAELEAENAAWNEKWRRSVESHQAASSRAQSAEADAAALRAALEADEALFARIGSEPELSIIQQLAERGGSDARETLAIQTGKALLERMAELERLLRECDAMLMRQTKNVWMSGDEIHKRNRLHKEIDAALEAR